MDKQDPALSPLEHSVLAVLDQLRPLGPIGVGRIQQEMPAVSVPSLDELADVCRVLAATGYLERSGHATYPMYREVDSTDHDMPAGGAGW